MHDVLRQRLLRKIESLPDEQVYQVLDYIEFLESKYVTAEGVTTSGLQKFAEGLEDKLRRRAVSPNTIREAFQLISAADRVLSGVSNAGRQILGDLGQALEVEEGDAPGSPATPSGGTGTTSDGETTSFEADPRKRRAAAGRTPASTTPADGAGAQPRTGGSAGTGGAAGGPGGGSEGATGAPDGDDTGPSDEGGAGGGGDARG